MCIALTRGRTGRSTSDSFFGIVVFAIEAMLYVVEAAPVTPPQSRYQMQPLRALIQDKTRCRPALCTPAKSILSSKSSSSSLFHRVPALRVRLLSKLRIHDSAVVDFYVRVASGPIIEDCSRLRFAPSGLRYPEYHHHLQVTFRNSQQEWCGGD